MPLYLCTHLFNFIKDYYPYFKECIEDNIVKELEKIIHKIGAYNYLESIEGSVICKLINQTLGIQEKWSNCPKMLELSFLTD